MPETIWSVVLRAKEGTPQEKCEALENLCGRYWYPVYAFLRRPGRSPHLAQDLTQGFFANLLEHEWLTNVH